MKSKLQAKKNPKRGGDRKRDGESERERDMHKTGLNRSRKQNLINFITTMS